MKKEILFIFTLVISLFMNSSYSQEYEPYMDFVMIWDTTKPGASADNEVWIKLDPYYNYDFTVSWGEPYPIEIYIGSGHASLKHYYSEPGVYTIRIKKNGGNPFSDKAIFPKMEMMGDEEKLLEIVQWGTNEWQSMYKAFSGCSNLTIPGLIDKPNFSNVTDMARMFEDCKSFTGAWNMNTWDTSNVTNMFGMFVGAELFNGRIGDWDVSNVTDMSFMFNRTLFNRDLSSWDVSNVTNMFGLFQDTPFNEDISTWNTSNVISMRQMFLNTPFNQNISSWNVSNVMQMDNMFKDSFFNQDISSWDVSNVIQMSRMFYNTPFNQDISSWDVSNVTQMEYMFYNTPFNQDISSWDVSNVEFITGMLYFVTLSTTNYDKLLKGWSGLNLQNGLEFYAASQYCNSASERQHIIDTYNWTITDYGQSTSNCYNETAIVLDSSGALSISDTNDGNNNTDLFISLRGDTFVIENLGPITLSGGGVQINSNIVEIPMVSITNGITIDGKAGDNTLRISSSITLAGTNNDLSLNNINTTLYSSVNLQLNALNVSNGNYNTNGSTTTVDTFANFYNSSTLSGTGTINGMVNMNANTNLAPGTSPGILNTGNLVLEAGSVFDVEVNGPTLGAEHDLVEVTGSVNINDATLKLIGGYANEVGDEIVIISNDGTDPVIGTFAVLAVDDDVSSGGLDEGDVFTFGDFTGIISYVGGDGNDVSLVGVNSTPPQIVSLFPDRGATDVPLDIELVITFDRDMELVDENVGLDNRVLYFFNDNSNGIFAERLDSPRVEGNKVFLTPGYFADFDPNGTTTVYVGGNLFKDFGGLVFPGIDGSDPWTFKTIATVDKEVASPIFSPVSEAVDILSDQVFTISFPEEMVMKRSDNTVPFILFTSTGEGLPGGSPVQNPALSYNGQQSIISFQLREDILDKLNPSSTYRISFGQSALEDVAGNDWGGTGGIDQNGAFQSGLNWTFTTASNFDFLPPTATLFPATGTNLLSVDQVFTVTFNELVQLSSIPESIFILELSPESGWLEVDELTFDNGDFSLTDDGVVSTLTITPKVDLPSNKALSISIPQGLFEDLAGNPWEGTQGINDGLNWYFTTGLGDTACISGDVDLDITLDGFAGETSWELTNETGTIIASMSYSINDNNSTTNTSFTGLVDGVYTFTIYDSYGDGICCGQGLGSFTVSKNGNEIFSGGRFLSEQAFQFCIDGSIDSEMPVIECSDPPPFNAGTNCSLLVTIADPTATDNASTNFTFEGIRNDGKPMTDPFFTGITIISWTATDEAGNVSEACEQLITVNSTGDCWFSVGPEIVGETPLISGGQFSIPGDSFGSGVAINAEGNIAAYVMPNANGNGNTGNVIVLEGSGTSWSEVGSPIPGGFSGPSYSGIDLNDSGNILAVTQNNTGDVQVYKNMSGNWVNLGPVITAIGTPFVQKLDLDASGNVIAIAYAGADSRGIVVVYEYNGFEWTQKGSTLIGENLGDYFGRDVSLNADGSTLAIGAYQIDSDYYGLGIQHGYTKVYRFLEEDWEQIGSDLIGDGININGKDQFGISVKLNDVGDRLIASANQYAKVFEWKDNSWNLLGNRIDQQAYQVDINAIGNLVLMGGNTQPGVILKFTNGLWEILGQPIYAGVGKDVAMNNAGDIIIMGNSFYSDYRGKAAIFEYSGALPMIDSSPPTITCPPNLLQVIPTGDTAQIEFTDPTATDDISTTFTFNGTRSDSTPSDPLTLSDPFPLGVTTISWTATDEAGNTSLPCDQIISIVVAEVVASLDGTGTLTIPGIAGNQNYTISAEGDYLILSSSVPILITGIGVEHIDALTVKIPVAEITNGLSLNGGADTDTIILDTSLSLLGDDNGLTLLNFENIQVTGTGNLELNALQVSGGNFDTNGTTTTVITVATFDNGATLSGSGTIMGEVNIEATAILEPGTSPGILSTGDLNLELGAIFSAEVNGPTPVTEYDQVVVTGIVAINNATLQLEGGYANATTDIIVLISNDSDDAIIGTFDGLAEGAEVNFGGFNGIISYVGGDGNDVVLRNTVSETAITSFELIEGTFLQGADNPSPTGPILRAEQGKRVVYMKFDLGTLGGPITKAQLKMQVASDPGSGTLEVFLGSSSDWTESGLNGNNKPTEIGSALATITGTHSLGQMKVWDLDVGRLPNGGPVTLILKHSNGNDVAFASDETNQAPQLIITSAGANGPIDADGDGFDSDVDCNDNNPDIHPGAIEVCDGVDNNCDGLIDDQDPFVTCNSVVEGPADLIDATFLQGSSNPSPTGPILRAEQGKRVVYMKFDLGTLGGPMTQAQLKMQVASDPGSGTLEVYLGSSSDWTESGLNGSNKPTEVGSALATITGTHSLGQTKVWDLDVGRLPNGGLVTLIVKHSNGNDVAFASDETNQAPQLIITSAGGNGPIDADGDGFDSDVDCNDNNPAIHPGAIEVCDGVDNNCDGLIDDQDPFVTCNSVEGPADLIDATFLQGSSNPSPTGPILRTEQGNRVTYLKFDLGTLGGPITQAQLKMQVASDPGTGTLQVFLGSSSGWTEAGLNGSNKPVEVGTALATITGTHSIGQIKVWDLDVGGLPNGGLVTLIVKHSNGNDVAFASDETNQAPQLIITSDGSGGPDPLLADKQVNTLSLSPNPATNNITARFERPIKVKTIMVFDMIGRLVRTYKAEEVKNADGYGLDLNFIQPGSYIIKTIDEQGNQFQKQMAIDY